MNWTKSLLERDFQTFVSTSPGWEVTPEELRNLYTHLNGGRHTGWEAYTRGTVRAWLKWRKANRPVDGRLHSERLFRCLGLSPLDTY